MTRWDRDALEAPHTQREIDMIPQTDERFVELNRLRQALYEYQTDESNSRAMCRVTMDEIMSLRRELGI